MSEENLFARLTQLPRPHMVVPFPMPDGTEEEIIMRVLTAMEMSQCKSDAERRSKQSLSSKGSDPNDVVQSVVIREGEASEGYKELYRDFLTYNILFRACRNKDNIDKPVFPTLTDVAKHLGVDEAGILINHYYTTQLNKGLVIVNMTKDDMETNLKKIIDAGTDPSFFFNSFSSEMLKTFLSFTVSQLRSLQTDKSSPGSQQENIEKKE